MTIGVLSIGVVTPLGEDPEEVVRRANAGQCALARSVELADLPDPRAGLVAGPSLDGWLRRKKDIRLLPRAAVLALPAAGRAMAGFRGDPEELAIFVAIGREPPDEGDAEASLVAMARAGRLDRGALETGRALYPPLLPLRTLPNMVLAHVAIQHQIRGENGTYAGRREAGEQALRAALRAVEEGRAPACLVGAASSEVDLASARDRWRLGRTEPPGEAAIFALIGPGGRPLAAEDGLTARLVAAMGESGPVEGLYAVLPRG